MRESTALFFKPAISGSGVNQSGGCVLGHVTGWRRASGVNEMRCKHHKHTCVCLQTKTSYAMKPRRFRITKDHREN